MKIAVFLAEGFEEIEAVAIIDVLRRGGIEIDIVSIEKDKYIKGSHDICIVADKCFGEIDKKSYDGIVLPGGMPGTTRLENYQPLKELIVDYNEQEKLIGAICAAPKILGNMGLLKNREAICFPGFEEELEGARISKESIAVSGHIITGKGAGKAIEFALAVLGKVKGEEVAKQLQKKLIAD